MNLDLKDKRVLVVGASKNIGESIVRDFHKEGCKITMISRDEKKLSKLCKSIGGKNKGHEFYAADLLKKDAIKETIKSILKNGSIDIVVHNIGGALGVVNPLSEIELWLNVWKLNIGIAIEINNLLIPLMVKKKWGRIVHISSITAQVGESIDGPIPYSTSKAFLNSYVKSMGKKYASKKLVISAVMPGAILSKGKYWEKIQKENPDLLKSFLKEKQSIGRLGKPEEISSFVVFLGSKKSSFASGSIFPLHGGWNY